VYNNKRNRTSVIRFIDDVNILIFGPNIEDTYRNLERTYIACETWAKRYRSAFLPGKYTLLYLIRTLKRFNIKTKVQIGAYTIKPSQNIRILEVRVNSQLR
jgi:hypothetical protein